MQRYAAVWSEQSAGIALPMAAMTVGRGRGKGAIVNQLRFEAGLGHYSVNVAPDSVWIFRGVGRTTSRAAGRALTQTESIALLRSSGPTHHTPA